MKCQIITYFLSLLNWTFVFKQVPFYILIAQILPMQLSAVVLPVPTVDFDPPHCVHAAVQSAPASL